MKTVTAVWAVFTAAAAVIYWFVWVMGAAEVKGKRAIDLKMGFITRDKVHEEYKQYWPFFRRPKEIAGYSTNVPAFVDTFYNLVTGIYEATP
ncbi:24-methylenesterol C-methyltransferase protein [Dioscorea alata]|uniref:24-methylenesterol C-methyltransferase protein n=1 Tax=Dioscorea alata TaxID=55571 RepID=A0ACB7UMM2_DIOAL|nr:24-methylenesterol C-methyltransferase protein [Dioscorea alata]